MPENAVDFAVDTEWWRSEDQDGHVDETECWLLEGNERYLHCECQCH